MIQPSRKLHCLKETKDFPQATKDFLIMCFHLCIRFGHKEGEGSIYLGKKKKKKASLNLFLYSLFFI